VRALASALLFLACSHQAAQPISQSAPSSAPLPLERANISFVTRGAHPLALRLYSMTANDGDLRVGVTRIGTLRRDGIFVFDGPDRVTAELDARGVVVVTGPSVLRGDELPGDLARLLSEHHGTLRSALSVEQLTFDGDLVENRLRVTGLTPATRRLAAFVYILMSTIMP